MIGLILLCAVRALANRVLVVDSEARLAGAAVGGFDEIHLRTNITIHAGWTPISFGGVINGYGNSITVLSSTGVFDTLSNANLMNLTIIQREGSTTTGALARTAANVFVTGCTITLDSVFSADYALEPAAGLIASVGTLSLIGCVIDVSMSVDGGSAVRSIGGIAATCESLSITDCTIHVDFKLVGSYYLTAGGLAAMSNGVTISGCKATINATYSGSAGATIGGLIGNIGGQDATIVALVIRVPSAELSSTGYMCFGAAIGSSESSVLITNSASHLGLLSVNMTKFGVGGLVGAMSGLKPLTAIDVATFVDRINLTIHSDNSCSYGGVVGSCKLCEFSRSLFQGEVILRSTSPHADVGGAVGYANNISGDSSVSYVTIVVAEATITYLFVGGFVGNVNGGILQNLAAKLSIDSQAHGGGIGGIAGQSLATITASYANVSINIIESGDSTGMYTCMYGAIAGVIKATTISISYGILRATGKGSAGIGGLVGIVVKSAVRDSFALATINYTTGQEGIVGGLIGYAITCNVSNCYSYAEMNIDVSKNSRIGGLIGIWESGGSAKNAITYGSMQFTGTQRNTNIGTFAGRGGDIGTLTNCFTTQRVKMYESGGQVSFIPGQDSVPYSCGCAQLGDVSGCVDASNFKSTEYFAKHGIDITGSFRSKSGIMNGFIAPTSLPVPNNSLSQFTILDKARSPWATNNWKVTGDGALVLGIDYDFTCSATAGCHGRVMALGTITCNPGWLENTTHPCSTFVCTIDSECTNGRCIAGSCECATGYTGVDCSQQPCGPNGYLVNGVCACRSTEYFVDSMGKCASGCLGGCGNGVCTGINTCMCLAGYYTQGGKVCASYACNLVEPTCFGAATCEERKESSEYQCKCSSTKEYFELEHGTGRCTEGCINIQNGYCVGPNKAVCKAGWVDSGDNLCSKYDCTFDTTGSVCGGAGTCNKASKKCDCDYNARLDSVGLCVFENCVGLEHGTCADNKYTCYPGWENDGGKCNKYNCAIDNSPSVCGGAGTCNAATKTCTCATNAATAFTTSCQCTPGWYGSGGLCNLYNCTAASASNLCNGLGFCTASGECSCLQTAAPVTGTCESVAGKCPSCQNGNCLYDATTARPQCVCSAGYSRVGETCFQNNCGVCGNGTCKDDPSTQAITCVCNGGFTLINGACYKDVCGQCVNGTCLADTDSMTLSCRCNGGYTPIQGVCYLDNCLVCTNGLCITDDRTRTISCTCRGGHPPIFGVCVVNKGPLIVKIVVPIVVCVAVVVIIAVIIAVVCVRKHRREWAVAQPANVQKFGDFSGTTVSTV